MCPLNLGEPLNCLGGGVEMARVSFSGKSGDNLRTSKPLKPKKSVSLSCSFFFFSLDLENFLDCFDIREGGCTLTHSACFNRIRIVDNVCDNPQLAKV